MALLRNLSRRKLRTGLTIMGITIGIWALVVFGSMGNKINALVAGGSTYYADKIVVTDKSGGSFGMAPMEIATVSAIEKVDGVDLAIPEVVTMLDPSSAGGGMSMPDLITGGIPGADQGREHFKINYSRGRGLETADLNNDVAVLGSDIARKLNKNVGDTITVRGMSFQVVGVMEPTLTAPDTTVSLPLPAAQRVYAHDLPPVVRANLRPDQLATEIVVFPKAGTDIDALATRIESQVPNASAMTGKEFDKQIGSSVAILNAIIIGVALISLVVGGLSVINTMAMSVAERTREIGIKRAIGGSRLRVVRELVAEAGLIGLIGGLLGLFLGAIVVLAANEAGRSSGTILFDLTTGTAVFAVSFSTVLGAIAGIIPALHAARLDPVTALRYE